MVAGSRLVAITAAGPPINPSRLGLHPLRITGAVEEPREVQAAVGASGVRARVRSLGARAGSGAAAWAAAAGSLYVGRLPARGVRLAARAARPVGRSPAEPQLYAGYDRSR